MRKNGHFAFLTVGLGLVGCQVLPLSIQSLRDVADSAVRDKQVPSSQAIPSQKVDGTLSLRIRIGNPGERLTQARLSDIAFLSLSLKGPKGEQTRQVDVSENFKSDLVLEFTGLPSGPHELRIQARTSDNYLIGDTSGTYEVSQGKTTQASLVLSLIPDNGAISAVVSIVEPSSSSSASPVPTPQVGESPDTGQAVVAPPLLSAGAPYRVSLLAGSGQRGFVDGVGSAATFTQPMGTAVDASGNLYVMDHDRLRKVTPEGVVTTVVQSASFIDAERSAVAATVDAKGNIYVFQHIGCKIQKVSPQGEISDFAGSGSPGFADGLGAAAQFNRISGMARLQDGSFLVSDYWNSRIRKVTAEGQVSGFSGSGTAGSADGPPNLAQFSEPHGGALDAHGRYWLVDHNRSRIRYVDPDGTAHTLTNSNSTPVKFDWGLFVLPNLPGVGTLLSGKFTSGISLHTPDAGVVPYISGSEFPNPFLMLVAHPSGQVWVVDRRGLSIQRIQFGS